MKRILLVLTVAKVMDPGSSGHIRALRVNSKPRSPGPVAYRLDNEAAWTLRIPVPRCPFSLATLHPLQGTGTSKEGPNHSPPAPQGTFVTNCTLPLNHIGRHRCNRGATRKKRAGRNRTTFREKTRPSCPAVSYPPRPLATPAPLCKSKCFASVVFVGGRVDK